MLKSILAAALATGLGVSSAFAMPAPANPVGTDTNLVQAHFTGDGHHIGGRRHYRHRPYRHYRPRSGFSVELQFGGPRYRQVPTYRRGYVANYGARHHAWCEGKYRSYRRYDGTFQPYHGPRRRCNSPYDGI